MNTQLNFKFFCLNFTHDERRYNTNGRGTAFDACWHISIKHQSNWDTVSKTVELRRHIDISYLVEDTVAPNPCFLPSFSLFWSKFIDKTICSFSIFALLGSKSLVQYAELGSPSHFDFATSLDGSWKWSSIFTQNGPAGRHDEVELYELAESQPAEHASTSWKIYASVFF